MTGLHLYQAAFASAVAEGKHPVQAVREALRYSLDELSVVCGLTSTELRTIEAWVGGDPAMTRRVETALRLEEGSLVNLLTPGAEPRRNIIPGDAANDDGKIISYLV